MVIWLLANFRPSTACFLKCFTMTIKMISQEKKSALMRFPIFRKNHGPIAGSESALKQSDDPKVRRKRRNNHQNTIQVRRPNQRMLPRSRPRVRPLLKCRHRRIMMIRWAVLSRLRIRWVASNKKKFTDKSEINLSKSLRKMPTMHE